MKRAIIHCNSVFLCKVLNFFLVLRLLESSSVRRHHPRQRDHPHGTLTQEKNPGAAKDIPLTDQAPGPLAGGERSKRLGMTKGHLLGKNRMPGKKVRAKK